MTRDELEARLWRHMPRAHPAVIDDILTAADRYADHKAGITAERRAVLAQPVVHWQPPGKPKGTAACHGRVTRANVTTRTEPVTCGSCQQSRAWRAATEAAA